MTIFDDITIPGPDDGVGLSNALQASLARLKDHGVHLFIEHEFGTREASDGILHRVSLSGNPGAITAALILLSEFYRVSAEELAKRSAEA